jgi:hypothetical protein
MHQKLNERGKYCMQNNQLPIELKDNSIGLSLVWVDVKHLIIW